MIRVHDPYDLVPELFSNFTEFQPSSDDFQVEVIPHWCDEAVIPSTVYTIFISTEPDLHRASESFCEQIQARPNCVWACCQYSPTVSWPVPEVAWYWSNWAFTVRMNPGVEAVQLGPKPWMACALLGGWSNDRAILFDSLNRRNLLDRCLVNFHKRQFQTIPHVINGPMADRGLSEHQRDNPHMYWNYQTAAIRELDDPRFLDMCYTDDGIMTMRSISRPFQHGWISQVVPYRIYNSCYLSIVAETETPIDLNSIMMSEKIAKPMLVGHPFVVLSAPGFLSYLRDLGFKTFDTWIDESYDKITSKEQRARAIIDSVYEFSQLSDQTQQQYAAEMQLVTDHNRQLMLNQRWMVQPLATAIFEKLNFKPR